MSSHTHSTSTTTESERKQFLTVHDPAPASEYVPSGQGKHAVKFAALSRNITHITRRQWFERGTLLPARSAAVPYLYVPAGHTTGQDAAASGVVALPTHPGVQFSGLQLLAPTTSLY